MDIDEITIAAQDLRDAITVALNLFDAKTNHLHPDVEIVWRDVTTFGDERVRLVPFVTVSMKVFV